MGEGGGPEAPGRLSEANLSGLKPSMIGSHFGTTEQAAEKLFRDSHLDLSG